MEAIERNAAFVGKARDRVEFSPKDLTQVAGFLAKEREAKQVGLTNRSRVACLVSIS